MIRHLSPTDLQVYSRKLQELLSSVYSLSFDLSPAKIEELVDAKLEQMQGILQDGSGYIIAYFDEENLGGFAWYYIKTDFEKSSYFLNFIATSPQYQNRGIGQALMHYIEESARENNIRYIELHVTSDNFTAVRLYEKNQFKEVRKVMIKDILEND